jgi:hypothetical protein
MSEVLFSLFCVMLFFTFSYVRSLTFELEVLLYIFLVIGENESSPHFSHR